MTKKSQVVLRHPLLTNIYVALFDHPAIPVMSDSSYFEDALDSEFLDLVDALETKQQPATRVSAHDMGPSTSSKSFDTTNSASSTRTRVPQSHQNSDPYGEVFDLDDLEEIDNTMVYGIPEPSKPPVALARAASKTLQTTLRGGRVPKSPMKSGAPSRAQPTGERMRKTKTWDRTAFAKSGWKAIRPTAKPDAKTKGKGRANFNEEEGGDEVLLLEDSPDIPEYTSSKSQDLLLSFL